MKKEKYEKNIYVFDVSNVGISFRDAHKHSIEDIIEAINAADRIDRLMDNKH